MFVSFSLCPHEAGMVSYKPENICGLKIVRVDRPLIPINNEDKEYPYYQIVLEVEICGELRSHLIGVHDNHGDAYNCHNDVLRIIQEENEKEKVINVNVTPKPNGS